MKTINGLAGTFLAFMVFGAHALTYQPMLDEDLLAQAPAVVRGQVLASDDMATSRAGVTTYRLAVEQVYKGVVPVSELRFVVPGGGNGAIRRVPGMPVFNAGETVVLFLSKDSDGTYQLVQAALGAFRVMRDASGQLVFSRQLGVARALPVPVPGRGAINESPRDAAAFLQWLGDPQPAYAASTLNTGPRTEQDEFNTLGTPPSRWWTFDEGGTETLRAHASGQSGMPGGGFAEFREGIAAWNDDPASNIRYVYGGTTIASGGLRNPDGVSTILFDDPNNEIMGSFDCNSGGILAIGGFTTSGDTRNFRGQVFGEIVEGDIVTNDGTGCFFRMNNNTNGEEVFGHEVGHTLGLGHSCEESDGFIGLPGIDLGGDSCSSATPQERDALMKATPHRDGRGADLRADDEAGAAFLYPTQDGAGEPREQPDQDSGSNDDSPGDSGIGGNTGGVDDDGGGGGGCSLQPGARADMLLPLLLLFSAWRVSARWRDRGRIVCRSAD